MLRKRADKLKIKYCNMFFLIKLCIYTHGAFQR